MFYFLESSPPELTAVTATPHAGAEDGRSGQHVRGRLLFDGVYLQSTGAAVDQSVVAATWLWLATETEDIKEKRRSRGTQENGNAPSCVPVRGYVKCPRGGSS
jgi:hypothetical protein